MTEQAREGQAGGTWGPREAVTDWLRGAAARVLAFGPATEMMLDLVQVAAGSQVLDVGAGAGIRHWWRPDALALATDISASMLKIAAESARQAGLNNINT